MSPTQSLTTTNQANPLQPFNLGCSYSSVGADFYGDTFNSKPGGGSYAMEWTAQGIKIWSWPADSVPLDILQNQPTPSATWGPPTALFGGSECDVNRFFRDMKIVLNMDLCGDYAGAVWGSADNCPAITGKATCNEWVAQNPGNLTDIFWTINSIKVFELRFLPNVTSTRGPPRPTATTPTSTGVATGSATPGPNPTTLPGGCK